MGHEDQNTLRWKRLFHNCLDYYGLLFVARDIVQDYLWTICGLIGKRALWQPTLVKSLYN